MSSKVPNNIYSLDNIDKATFCPAPWIEAHISVTGDVYPCCYYDIRYPYGNVKNESLDSLLNNSKSKNIRKELLDGVKHEGCNNCWRDENLHGRSYRKDYLEGWKSSIEEPLKKTDEFFNIDTGLLQKLDLRFDNKCNLKCRVCGPMYSTSWFKDASTLKEKYRLGEGIDNYEYSISIDDNLFNSLLGSLSSIKLLFFAGGEPLIQDKHYKILEYAIKYGYAKNIAIQYNTNFSKLSYKNYDVLDLWKHFKRVTCVASLDDSGARGEYQRKNLIWEDVINNRKALVKYSNVDFGISSTVSIFNVFHILEFIEEWVELGYLNCLDGNILSFNMLTGPLYMDIVNLPDYYKEKISEVYTSFISRLSSDSRYVNILPEVQKVLNHINQERTIPYDKWAKDFYINNNTLDKLRNENFADTFPEYKKLMVELQNIIQND